MDLLIILHGKYRESESKANLILELLKRKTPEPGIILREQGSCIRHLLSEIAEFHPCKGFTNDRIKLNIHAFPFFLVKFINKFVEVFDNSR